MRFAPYWKAGGGVTISGGEPMMQSAFCAEVFRLLREKGVHTALDTSCAGGNAGAEDVLTYTSLAMVDVKFLSEEAYRKYCGAALRRWRSFAADRAHGRAALGAACGCARPDGWAVAYRRAGGVREKIFQSQKIELLPFRKLCLPKYEQMGIPSRSKNTPEAEEGAGGEAEGVIMKDFIILNGTMGAGKSTVCAELKELLPKCGFIEGDACWTWRADLGEAAKEMVLRNIAFLADAYLACPDYESVLLCWVIRKRRFCRDFRADAAALLGASLYASFWKKALMARLERDIAQGRRQRDVVRRSLGAIRSLPA